MNSWGRNFGDNGFFQIKDDPILINFIKMRFFDVFWNLNELKENEKKDFECLKEIQAQVLANRLPKTLHKKLPVKCPLCDKESFIDEFSGNIFEAFCPKCCGKFQPYFKDMLLDLNYRNI